MQRNLTRENCTQAFLNSRKRAEEQAAADEQAAAEAAEFEEAELIAMAIADTSLRRHDDLTTRKSSEARDSAESTALVVTTSTTSAVEQLERACSIALTRSEGGRNEQQVGSKTRVGVVESAKWHRTEHWGDTVTRNIVPP